MKKDLISILDLTREDVLRLFKLTKQLKNETKKNKFKQYLKNKTVALIFKKASNRTLASFQVGTWQLGGFSFNMSDSTGVGVRESAKDVALTLSRYVDGIVIRTYAQKEVEELAQFASVPVVNALTDFEHPCQALADFFTVWEKKNGRLENLKFAYIGDCNNVCNSLVFLASLLGVKITVASPRAYWPAAGFFEKYLKEKTLNITDDPQVAAQNADVIYTDVWVSMGQETEKERRRLDFQNFQINFQLTKLAKKDHFVMHCLPAHRGQEITDGVIDGPNSIVFDQAENRLHTQKAILVKLLVRSGKKEI